MRRATQKGPAAGMQPGQHDSVEGRSAGGSVSHPYPMNSTFCRWRGDQPLDLADTLFHHLDLNFQPRQAVALWR